MIRHIPRCFATLLLAGLDFTLFAPQVVAKDKKADDLKKKQGMKVTLESGIDGNTPPKDGMEFLRDRPAGVAELTGYSALGARMGNLSRILLVLLLLPVFFCSATYAMAISLNPPPARRSGRSIRKRRIRSAAWT